MTPRDLVPTAILIILCCVAMYFLLPAYTKYRETRSAVRELEQDLAEQQLEVQRLRRELDALRTDYRAIERVAREKFGLCREGEEIYHFDNPPARGAAAGGAEKPRSR
jgi:cell division protein FtsB